MIRVLLCLTSIVLLSACNRNETNLNTASNDNGADSIGTHKQGQIIAKEIQYEAEGVTMNGYLAYSDGSKNKRAGILILHEWWGHTEYVRQRADMLAELGYVALAVDMYGEGKTASHPDDAGKFAAMVMQNLDQSEAKFSVAYKILESEAMVKQGEISAVGYCFGGTLALTLANKGVDFDGIAVFHSGLDLPVLPNANLSAQILIQNGADDPFISAESVQAFETEMKKFDKPYTYISFPGVKHAYTNKDADIIGTKFNLPLEYNAEADLESWTNMVYFFQKIYPNN